MASDILLANSGLLSCKHLMAPRETTYTEPLPMASLSGAKFAHFFMVVDIPALPIVPYSAKPFQIISSTHSSFWAIDITTHCRLIHHQTRQ